MQEEILTFQLGSFTNRVLENWWDLEKLNAEKAFQQDADNIQNSIFVRGNPTKPRLLLFDLKDNLEKYKCWRAYEPPNKEDYKLTGMWDKKKIAIFNMMEENKGEEVNTGEDLPSLSYAEFDLTEHNFMRIPPVDNYFNLYVTGEHIIEKTDVTDGIEDRVRYFLEDSDHIGAFQIFVDIHSGYGPLNKFLLEYVKDECPKSPIMEYAFENDWYDNSEDTIILNDLKLMNRMLLFSELMENVNMYFPIDISQVFKFNHFNLDYIKKDKFNAFHLLPYVISNMSHGYRNTNSQQWTATVRGFSDILVPFERLKFMNACFHIQGFPQNLSTNLNPPVEKLNSIFEYKEYVPLCLFPLPEKANLKDHYTYAEDFTLRGGLEGIKIPKHFDETKMNFHVNEADVWALDTATRLFDEEVVKKYGVLQEVSETLKIETLPLHSAIFNSAIFSLTFNDWLTASKKMHNIAKLQFKKDSKIKDDDLKAMEHFYLDQIDAYEKEIDDS